MTKGKRLICLKTQWISSTSLDEDSGTINVKCISIKILQLGRQKSVQNLLKFTLFKFNIDFDIKSFSVKSTNCKNKNCKSHRKFLIND